MHQNKSQVTLADLQQNIRTICDDDDPTGTNFTIQTVWKNNERMTTRASEYKQEVGEKTASVPCWVSLITGKLKIDLHELFEKKIQKSEATYPIIRRETAIALLTF